MKVCTDSCLFGAWASTKISAEAQNILDIGTGTGLLSLMLQQQIPQATILGIDVDENAVLQAQENTANFKSISIQQANVLHLEESPKFDVIVCNPPFYQNQLQSPNIQKNLAHHTSQLTHKALASKMASLLMKNAQAFVLLPFSNYKSFIELAINAGLFVHKTVLVKQTAKHSFFRVMLEFRLVKAQDELQEVICIKEAENTYSKEFVSYLKEYYLYF